MDDNEILPYGGTAIFGSRRVNHTILLSFRLDILESINVYLDKQNYFTVSSIYLRKAFYSHCHIPPLTLRTDSDIHSLGSEKVKVITDKYENLSPILTFSTQIPLTVTIVLSRNVLPIGLSDQLI